MLPNPLNTYLPSELMQHALDKFEYTPTLPIHLRSLYAADAKLLPLNTQREKEITTYEIKLLGFI